MKIALAIVAVVVTAFPAVHAQDQAEPKLDVIAIPPPLAASGPTPIILDWAYEFVGAAAPAGSVVITWNLTACPLVFANETTTSFTVEAGKTLYEGTTIASVAENKDVPGLKSILCKLQGDSATDPTPTVTAHVEKVIQFTVEFRPGIVVNVPAATKQAGPQKQIPYAVEITNTGNARTVVNFEMLDEPNGRRWNVILPDPLVLDSPTSGAEGKTTDTVIITVSTPFENGYVSDSGNYRIVLHVASADQSDKMGEDQVIELHSRAQGWYVPGPAPALLLAGLALAAVVRRRVD